jgi:excisionase family DNA binding protein
MDEPILLNKKTAAESLGVSVRTLEKLVRRRELLPVRIGDRVLFSRATLLTFVERRQRAVRSNGVDSTPVGSVVM